MNEQKLDKGMLLLDPSGPTVYTAISSRTVVAHHGSCSETARLTFSGVPKGWRVINNRPLARMLVADAERCAEVATGRLLELLTTSAGELSPETIARAAIDYYRAETSPATVGDTSKSIPPTTRDKIPANRGGESV